MPIYEYKCPNGHLFEVFHGMTEPGPAECEVCGAAPLERVLHPVAVHYKGSGFYSTDYGRGGRKAEGLGRARTRRRRATPAAARTAAPAVVAAAASRAAASSGGGSSTSASSD